MSRRKNILLASACIILGMALAGPAAQAAEAFLKAYPSTHTMYLDGQQVELEAYTINGSNYVRLRDVGEAVGFNVYWDSAAGAVQIDSDTPYTGQPPAAETAASTDLDTVRQDIAALVNQARREHGLPELAIDQRLMTAAQVCADRRYTWHHTREECGAAAVAGYPSGFGSNLTVFTGSAASGIARLAVDNWANSPGHLQTMLDARADSLGVGVAVRSGVTYCYLFVGKPGTINPYR